MTVAAAGGQGAGDTTVGDKTTDDAAAVAAAAAAAAQKTTDDAAAVAAAAAAAAAAAGAPAAYALTVPEGGYVDASDLVKVEALARARNWTNDDAQAFVNARAKEFGDLAAAFREETLAHPTYGGTHFADSEKHINRVIDRFAPAGDPLGDEFRRDLAKTGYGSKLSTVAFLTRVGAAMAEDGHVVVQGTGGTETPALSTLLYGDTKK